jgi:hypothetical protein
MSEGRLSFAEMSVRYFEPASIWTMVLGVVALCQPWSLALHSNGATIVLIGLIGFNVFSKIKPAEPTGTASEHGRDRP